MILRYVLATDDTARSGIGNLVVSNNHRHLVWSKKNPSYKDPNVEKLPYIGPNTGNS